MDDLDALLDAAIADRETDPETDKVDVLVRGSVWTLKFTELDSFTWANCAGMNPPRATSKIDRHYGHNFHGTARSAAPLSGVRIVDGEDVALTVEQWGKLWRAISPNEFKTVADVLLGLNEYRPEQRLEAAKKALTPDPPKKQS